MDGSGGLFLFVVCSLMGCRGGDLLLLIHFEEHVQSFYFTRCEHTENLNYKSNTQNCLYRLHISKKKKTRLAL